MGALTDLFEIDFVEFIIVFFIIMVGINTVVKIVGEFSKFIGKPFKWVQKKNEDHELLVKTINGLNDLQQKHNDDIAKSVDHENKISDDIQKLATEIKDTFQKTEEQLKTFAENRIHDREQSFSIQKQLTDSIKAIEDRSKNRDKQMDNLMFGTMELLGNKIDDRFSRYVELNGIPENEVDEFESLYKAYAATGGNSTRKHKYEYVVNNFKVIPVEVNLINDKSK